MCVTSKFLVCASIVLGALCCSLFVKASSEKGKTQNNSHLLDCNAFEKWEIQGAVPAPPPEMDQTLIEGKSFPGAGNAQKLNDWLGKMGSFEKIVEAGCACQRYVYPRDKSGNLDFGKMPKSTLLAYVVKSHRVRIKKFLNEGKFDLLTKQTSSIFDIARTYERGEPLLVDFLVAYRFSIREGCSAIRDCLYFKRVPDQLLHELDTVLWRFENGRVASAGILGESNLMLDVLASARKMSDLLEPMDAGHITGDLAENNSLLQEIVHEHKQDFDIKATKALLKSLAAEASANALMTPKNRKTPVRNKVAAELDPIFKAFAKVKASQHPDHRQVVKSLSSVRNLAGKVLALDCSEVLTSIINMEDSLLLEIAATKLAIHINQFERLHHNLPKAISELKALRNPGSTDTDSWLDYEPNFDFSKREFTLKPLPQSHSQERVRFSIPKPEF